MQTGNKTSYLPIANKHQRRRNKTLAIYEGMLELESYLRNIREDATASSNLKRVMNFFVKLKKFLIMPFASFFFNAILENVHKIMLMETKLLTQCKAIVSITLTTE